MQIPARLPARQRNRRALLRRSPAGQGRPRPHRQPGGRHRRDAPTQPTAPGGCLQASGEPGRPSHGAHSPEEQPGLRGLSPTVRQQNRSQRGRSAWASPHGAPGHIRSRGWRCQSQPGPLRGQAAACGHAPVTKKALKTWDGSVSPHRSVVWPRGRGEAWAHPRVLRRNEPTPRGIGNT